jgi:hypothetical protein
MTVVSSYPAASTQTPLLRVDVMALNMGVTTIQTNESACNIWLDLYSTPDRTGTPVWSTPTDRACSLALIIGAIPPHRQRTISDYFPLPPAGKYYGRVNTAFVKDARLLNAGSVTIP